jgi:hypothetical protein
LKIPENLNQDSQKQSRFPETIKIPRNNQDSQKQSRFPETIKISGKRLKNFSEEFSKIEEIYK